jgi:hypothetical protein
LWLGDFVGGALLFEDGTKHEEKYKWHKINGRIPHWNEPHEGNKYAIVLYRRAIKHTKQQMMAWALKKRKEREAVQGASPDEPPGQWLSQCPPMFSPAV